MEGMIECWRTPLLFSRNPCGIDWPDMPWCGALWCIDKTYSFYWDLLKSFLWGIQKLQIHKGHPPTGSNRDKVEGLGLGIREPKAWNPRAKHVFCNNLGCDYYCGDEPKRFLKTEHRTPLFPKELEHCLPNGSWVDEATWHIILPLNWRAIGYFRLIRIPLLMLQKSQGQPPVGCIKTL